MAIDLDDATTDNVDFGDIPTDGLTAITVAVTVRLTAPAATGRTVTTKANNSWPDLAYTMQIRATDEVGFGVVGSGGNPAVLAMQTTGLNLASGSLYRIVAWWDAALDDIEIWVNGVLEADAVWQAAPGPTAMRTTNAPHRVGDSNGSVVALGGEYSEVAVWNHVVPQWFREAYGKGLSPRFYRKGGILYCPLWNTGHLIDQWGGMNGTPTGAVSAAHPRVYYPAPSPLLMGFEPPLFPKIVRLRGRDDSTIRVRGRDDATIGLRGRDDATIRIKGE